MRAVAWLCVLLLQVVQSGAWRTRNKKKKKTVTNTKFRCRDLPGASNSLVKFSHSDEANQEYPKATPPSGAPSQAQRPPPVTPTLWQGRVHSPIQTRGHLRAHRRLRSSCHAYLKLQTNKSSRARAAVLRVLTRGWLHVLRLRVRAGCVGN